MTGTAADTGSKQGHLCLKSAALTDVGLRREENQDSFQQITTDNFQIFVVADGMGGVRGGAVASAQAIQDFTAKIKAEKILAPEVIKAAVQHANSVVFEKGSSDPALAGMGTTFVSLGFIGSKLYVTNVGDSRAYRIRGGVAKQITQDHTLVMELLKTGAITSDQVESHPVSHMLTRSLGPTPEIEIDCWEYEYGPARGDHYLLCSDGLYNLVSETEIAKIVSSSTPEQATKQLVDLANSRGGTDNITVIVVKVEESFPKSAEDYVDQTKELNEPPTLELEPSTVEQAIQQSTYTNGQGRVSPEIRGHSNIDTERLATEAEYRKVTEVLNQPEIGLWDRLKDRRHLLVVAVVAALTVGFFGGIVSRDRAPKVSPRIEKIEEPPVTQLPVPTSVPSGVTYYSGLSREEALEISKRKRVIREQLALMDEQIRAFDQPVDGTTSEVLRDAGVERDEMFATLTGIKAGIDEATRDLARWYGRRKRLQSADPLSLAGEVSATSSDVKKKKEDFEQATWTYLREAEKLRKTPTDTALEQRVNDLARIRKDRLAEVTEQVRLTIDENIQKTSDKIGDLTVERDRLESALKQSDEEVQLARVLMSSDRSAREKKREEIVQRRDKTLKELEQLERLLPLAEELAS